MRRTAMAVGAVTALGALAGCAPAADPPLTIYAAASLNPAIDEVARAFEEAHAGVTIAPVSYDGSAVLATQIIDGAPAGVFAAADERTAQSVVDAGLADGAQVFATNTLVIAVPTDNPGGVTGIDDLARVTTVLCAPEVPCGAAAERLLALDGVSVTPASLEQNVTAVREKVAAGEANAGLVYTTDVLGDPDVTSIVPARADEVVNSYAALALKDAPSAAQEFLDFLTGPEGQAILAEHGFGPADRTQ